MFWGYFSWHDIITGDNGSFVYRDIMTDVTEPFVIDKSLVT